MSNINIPEECEEHKSSISIICLSRNCNQRCLCLKCLRNHDIIHSRYYVPVNKLIENQNNIILIDEFIKVNLEKEDENKKCKREIMIHVNQLIQELRTQIENKINEIFRNILSLETLREVNNLSLDEISQLYYNLSIEERRNINEINFDFEFLKQALKEKFSNILDSFNINLFDSHSKLREIGKAVLECETPKKDTSRILFDSYSEDVYYIYGCHSNQVYHYDNFYNFKKNIVTNTITLPKLRAGVNSVIFKGHFYYFESTNYEGTNNLIKFDLKNNRLIGNKKILPDAVLGNSQSCYGGWNDIILISDEKNLYAVYSSNNNNKRISIAWIDENELTITKIWNTDSLEKKNCGPIFMINNILYHIKTYDKENDAVSYSYDLSNGNSSQLNIPFENKGGHDDCLAYYPNLKCLMTVNKYNVYKYKVSLEN